MTGKLTKRQQRFIEEYLVDYCGKKAAVRAGYSPRSAQTAATSNLQNPLIAGAIDSQMAVIGEKTGVTAETVVRELGRIAFADMTRIVDVEAGVLMPNLTTDDKAALQGVKVKVAPTYTEREFKLYDKLKALEMLCKRFGLFSEAQALTEELPQIVDDIGQEE